MGWELTVTNSGLNALARPEGGRITAVKGFGGTGTVDKPEELTELVAPVQEMVVINDGAIGNVRHMRFQAEAPGDSYILSQIGLFISIEDEPFILYMVGQNKEGNVLPDKNAAPDFIAEYTFGVRFQAGISYDVPPPPHGFVTPDALDMRINALRVELGEAGAEALDTANEALSVANGAAGTAQAASSAASSAADAASGAMSAAQNADTKAQNALTAAGEAQNAVKGAFDFDNAAAFAGVTRTTEFAADSVTEIIARTATGVKAAERVTTFAGDTVTTVTTVYENDGEAVLRRTAATAVIGDLVVETVV